MMIINKPQSLRIAQQKAGLFFSLDARNPTGDNTLLVDNSSIVNAYDLTAHIAASQSNGSKQPTFKQNQINGMPVINCDGSTQSLQVTGLNNISGSGDLTAIFVIKPTSTSGSRWLLDTNSSTNRLIFYIAGYDAGGGRAATFSSTTGLQVLSFRMDSAGATGTCYRNGNSIASGVYGGRAFGATTGLLADSAASSGRFAGQCLAIDLYKTLLSAQDHLDIVREYCKLIGVASA